MKLKALHLVIPLFAISIGALAQAPSAPTGPTLPSSSVAAHPTKQAGIHPATHKFLWFGQKTDVPAQRATDPAPAPRASSHTVTVSMDNASCNTTNGKACTGQIYRTPVNCPAGGGIAGPSWTQLIGNLAATTITATGSHFTFTDSAVSNGQVYCYYGTNIYTTGTDGPSGPSNTFQVQIPGSPDPPTVSGVIN